MKDPSDEKVRKRDYYRRPDQYSSSISRLGRHALGRKHQEQPVFADALGESPVLGIQAVSQNQPSKSSRRWLLHGGNVDAIF
jgi:hypothetical protein